MLHERRAICYTLARRKDLSLTENDHLAHDIVEF